MNGGFAIPSFKLSMNEWYIQHKAMGVITYPFSNFSKIMLIEGAPCCQIKHVISRIVHNRSTVCQKAFHISMANFAGYRYLITFFPKVVHVFSYGTSNTWNATVSRAISLAILNHGHINIYLKSFRTKKEKRLDKWYWTLWLVPCLLVAHCHQKLQICRTRCPNISGSISWMTQKLPYSFDKNECEDWA